MKTTIKIQKTALTATAALIALVIFSFAVNAQFAMKSLFEDNETSHILMAMGNTNNNFGTTAINAGNFTESNAFAAYLVKETESTLQLEDWMMDEASFATMTFIEAETESPLGIEDWMTNESNFDVYPINFETETEEELNLEDWMTDEKTFDINSVNLEIESEAPMTVDGWMLDENKFNENNNKTTFNQKVNNKVISNGKFIFTEVTDESTLKVEDWMLHSKVW